MDSSQWRAETLQRFARWQLVPNKHLPLLESLTDLRPKPATEIAARAVAAGYAAAVCFGAPRSELSLSLKQFGLWQHLSPDEQQLLSEATPSDQSLGVHGWLVESIQFLAWCLSLSHLDTFEPCSDSLATCFPRAGTDPSAFISKASLRPLSELLQEADTLYMLHWRAVENNLIGATDVRLVLPRISFRRHAADWAIGVAESWQDVPLDT